MTAVGADVAALADAARVLGAAADELDADSSGLVRLLGSVDWLGAVAREFSALFETTHVPFMRSTAEFVREAARALAAQADQQARSSASGGGALSATGTVVGSDHGRPSSVGAAASADSANRVRFEADLSALEGKQARGTLSRDDRRTLDNLHAIEHTIERIESNTDPLTHEHLHASLYIYQPTAFGGDGRGAVAVGDLDNADHVAFVVPGMGTTLASMDGGRALAVYQQARWESRDGQSVAVVDWVGYDAPSRELRDLKDIAGVAYRDEAIAGATLLASDIAVFRAGRGADQPHLTVVANSYGSTTAAIAAGEDHLAADDLVLTGSPGAGDATDASGLSTGREHTWVGSASHDPVTKLGVTGWADPTQVLGGAAGNPQLLGHDPSEDRFHAQRFEAESPKRGTGAYFADHGRYYDEGSESLRNVGAVVVGQYGMVVHADARFDPWYGPMVDPEGGRSLGSGGSGW